mmetsp:Transcript_20617/g.64571  ORF Transcript_20617/g.64571 Transcript_20617/m.64571 type:complete len:270 (-) Transcript_20617:453-1262(-)
MAGAISSGLLRRHPRLQRWCRPRRSNGRWRVTPRRCSRLPRTARSTRGPSSHQAISGSGSGRGRLSSGGRRSACTPGRGCRAACSGAARARFRSRAPMSSSTVRARIARSACPAAARRTPTTAARPTRGSSCGPCCAPHRARCASTWSSSRPSPFPPEARSGSTTREEALAQAAAAPRIGARRRGWVSRAKTARGVPFGATLRRLRPRARLWLTVWRGCRARRAHRRAARTSMRRRPSLLAQWRTRQRHRSLGVASEGATRACGCWCRV